MPADLGLRTSDLETLALKTAALVRETGAFIEHEKERVSDEAIEDKAVNSLVSYVDRQAEQRLVEGLSRLLPGATFFTEEDTVARVDSDRQWIIDPLDGTTNFLHQIPCFSVSVALRLNGQLALGVVYEITRQECFYAWLGGGAYLNGRPIRASSRKQLRDAVVATGFPYGDFSWIPPYFEVLGQLMRQARGIRRLGSAAADLAFVACGRFDGFFEILLNPWDVAAGALIAAEAGALVTDFRGGDNFLFGREIIAANPLVFQELKPMVDKAFYKQG